MKGLRVSTGRRSRIVLRARLAGLAAVLLVAMLNLALPPVPARADDPAASLTPISIGFPRHAYGTWTGKIADGSYQKAAGKTIRWVPFDTDSAVAAAMASGRIDIGMMGASVVAGAVTRGLDLKAFYVMGWSRETEGLVVSNALDISLGDIKGGLANKVVAVPYGSTAHFRLLRSLKQWGMTPADMRIVNLQPRQIVEAWARSELDAALVTEPTLSELKAAGRFIPLPRNRGHEGLLLLAAGASFLKDNRAMLGRFVDVIARADTVFSEMSGPLTPDRIEVKSIAFMTGLPASDVIEAIARYRPPLIGEQATKRWLAGGAESALAAQLKASAEVWKWGGRLDKMDADYAAAVAPDPVEEALSIER